MPALTRRRSADAPDECWHVFYGDVRVGTIAIRTGMPPGERDWTDRKYAMWERGERMPTQKPSSMMRCPCGEVFDSHLPEHTLIHVPHVTASQAADGIRR